MATAERAQSLGLTDANRGLEVAGVKVVGSQQSAITSLTDNSGGTPSDTLADVPAAYSEATLANQIASLAAKINAILTALRAHGLIA